MYKDLSHNSIKIMACGVINQCPVGTTADEASRFNIRLLSKELVSSYKQTNQLVYLDQLSDDSNKHVAASVEPVELHWQLLNCQVIQP